MEPIAKKDAVLVFDFAETNSESKGKAVLKTSFNVVAKSLVGQAPNAGGLVMDVDVGRDNLTVQSYVEAVVHGSLTADAASDAATLLVLQFAFCPRSRSRRFRDVSITLTFSAGTVTALAPSNRWVTGTTTIDRERSHTISPSLEGSVGPAKGELSYEWKQTDSKKIENHVWIEGMPKSLGERPKGAVAVDSAMWELHENKQNKVGVPSYFRAAVLLKRGRAEKELPFEASLTITGDVHTHALDWAKIHNLPGAGGKKGAPKAEKERKKLHKWRLHRSEKSEDRSEGESEDELEDASESKSGDESEDTSDNDGESKKKKKDENTKECAAPALVLYFNPKLENLNPLGLDPTRLAAVKLDNLKQLVHVRSWTESPEEQSANGTAATAGSTVQTTVVTQVQTPAPVTPAAPEAAPQTVPQATTQAPTAAATAPAAATSVVATTVVQPAPVVVKSVAAEPAVPAASLALLPGLSGLTAQELDATLTNLMTDLALVDEEAGYVRRLVELAAEKRRLVLQIQNVRVLRSQTPNSK